MDSRKFRNAEGDHVILWCPACDEPHVIHKAMWTWDPSTLSVNPSIKVTGGRQGSDHVCHSFLKDSVWEYCSDSTHSLAGQSVPAVDFPSYWWANG